MWPEHPAPGLACTFIRLSRSGKSIRVRVAVKRVGLVLICLHLLASLNRIPVPEPLQKIPPLKSLTPHLSSATGCQIPSSRSWKLRPLSPIPTHLPTPLLNSPPWPVARVGPTRVSPRAAAVEPTAATFRDPRIAEVFPCSERCSGLRLCRHCTKRRQVIARLEPGGELLPQRRGEPIRE